jgi:preprotein translocase subunit YajC
MEFLMLLTPPEQGDAPPIGLFEFGSPFIMMGIAVFAIYFLFLRPESKRKKKAAEMLNLIEIADEVVTAGGIIGRVIQIDKEGDTLVIETGGDKTRFRILKSYIIENRTVKENV